MPDITIRDLPEDLHLWLKQSAASHHRSMNKEVIAALQALRGAAASSSQRASLADIMAIAHQVASAQEYDARSAEEIMGYDTSGLPR